MRTTLILPDRVVGEAMTLAKLKSKTQLILLALQEFIRQKKIERVIKRAGRLPLNNTWERARHGR